MYKETCYLLQCENYYTDIKHVKESFKETSPFVLRDFPSCRVYDHKKRMSRTLLHKDQLVQ